MNLLNTPSTSAPLVRIKGLAKSYRQGAVVVHALSDIDLEIHAGEFTCLVGPSGSGKTTLLNLIGALDQPDSGEMYLGGQSMAALPGAQLADLRLHKIGFVFQDFNLLPVLSALENVEYVLLLQGVPAAQRRQRANDALVQLGLDGCQHRRPSQLSGGQQQRVAVARAIVAKPLLVLADEPTANLDSATGAALLDTMLDLNRTCGTTFVFSTHDDMVMRYAQRTVDLRDGRIAGEHAHAVS